MDGARMPETTGLGHLSWQGEHASATGHRQRAWPLRFPALTLFKSMLTADRIGHEFQEQP